MVIDPTPASSIAIAHAAATPPQTCTFIPPRSSSPGSPSAGVADFPLSDSSTAADCAPVVRARQVLSAQRWAPCRLPRRSHLGRQTVCHESRCGPVRSDRNRRPLLRGGRHQLLGPAGDDEVGGGAGRAVGGEAEADRRSGRNRAVVASVPHRDRLAGGGDATVP